MSVTYNTDGKCRLQAASSRSHSKPLSRRVSSLDRDLRGEIRILRAAVDSVGEAVRAVEPALQLEARRRIDGEARQRSQFHASLEDLRTAVGDNVGQALRSVGQLEQELSKVRKATSDIKSDAGELRRSAVELRQDLPRELEVLRQWLGRVATVWECTAEKHRVELRTELRGAAEELCNELRKELVQELQPLLHGELREQLSVEICGELQSVLQTELAELAKEIRGKLRGELRSEFRGEIELQFDEIRSSVEARCEHLRTDLHEQCAIVKATFESQALDGLLGEQGELRGALAELRCGNENLADRVRLDFSELTGRLAVCEASAVQNGERLVAYKADVEDRLVALRADVVEQSNRGARDACEAEAKQWRQLEQVEAIAWRCEEDGGRFRHELDEFLGRQAEEQRRAWRDIQGLQFERRGDAERLERAATANYELAARVQAESCRHAEDRAAATVELSALVTRVDRTNEALEGRRELAVELTVEQRQMAAHVADQESRFRELRGNLDECCLAIAELRERTGAATVEQAAICEVVGIESRSRYDLLRRDVTSLSQLVDAALEVDDSYVTRPRETETRARGGEALDGWHPGNRGSLDERRGGIFSSPSTF